MIWEVFRREEPGDSHRHVGDVHASDREMAKLFASVQHGRRMRTNSLWVVPRREIGEVRADDVPFGGATDKAYRWATTYNDIDASFSREVEDSEAEQREVARKRREVRRERGDAAPDGGEAVGEGGDAAGEEVD